jgi:hypothetical protein
MGLLADGVERFCADSLSLARLELREGARSMSGDVAKAGLFAVLAAIGVGLLMVALALWLSPAIGTTWAFVAVGLANMLAGAVGLKVIAGRLLAALKP